MTNIEENLLEKSFPFIKFIFEHPFEDHFRIWVNTIIKAYNFHFWYDVELNKWRIENNKFYKNFKDFLNAFINGLIYWKIY